MLETPCSFPSFFVSEILPKKRTIQTQNSDICIILKRSATLRDECLFLFASPQCKMNYVVAACGFDIACILKDITDGLYANESIV